MRNYMKPTWESASATASTILKNIFRTSAKQNENLLNLKCQQSKEHSGGWQKKEVVRMYKQISSGLLMSENLLDSSLSFEVKDSILSKCSSLNWLAGILTQKKPKPPCSKTSLSCSLQRYWPTCRNSYFLALENAEGK